MSLPSFGMLDEQVNKLFKKDHVQGLLKFKSKTTINEKTDVKESVDEGFLSFLKFLTVESKKGGKPQRVVFKTNVAHDLNTKELLGAFILKYHFPQHGTCITERWDTNNMLNSTVVWKGIVPNLKVKLHNAFAPMTKASRTELKADYGNECYRVRGSICPSANELEVSGVAFLNEWYVGAQTSTDILLDGDVKAAFCLGRRNKFYNAHCFYENTGKFGANLFVQAQQNLQLGVRLGWENQSSGFSIATKYNVHDRLTLLAKVDNQSQLDISAIHKVSPDVKLILSATLQGSQNGVNSSGFGAGLVYKPE